MPLPAKTFASLALLAFGLQFAATHAATCNLPGGSISISDDMGELR